MNGRIQIDIWGGDMHQRLVREHLVDNWSTAFPIIQEAVDAGLLANVLHTDFKAPEGVADAAISELIRERADG